jgi:glycosyltransferase involved in cell wall biosynthesis
LGRSFYEAFYESPEIRSVLKTVRDSVDLDVVHVHFFRMAQYAHLFPDLPQSIDLIDALSLIIERRLPDKSWPLSKIWGREHVRVRREEQAALRAFDTVQVTSPVDRDHLKTMQGSKALRVVPNGVDLDRFEFAGRGERTTTRILFTGNMAYEPNIRAVEYFAEEIFPGLRASHSQVRFAVAGIDPVRRVQALDDRDGIDILGFVPSIADELQQCTLAVCPMLSGSGIQNKVLEAMATGTPVVATPIAVSGVQGAVAETHYLEAEEPDEFQDQVDRLLDDPETRRELGRRARSFMEENYAWNQVTGRVEKAFKDACRRKTVEK